MLSKDQQLLEKAYQKILIKEDPDTSHSLDNKLLKWHDSDAWAFGFVSIDQTEIEISNFEEEVICVLKGFGPAWKDRLYIKQKVHEDLFLYDALTELVASPQGIIERYFSNGNVKTTNLDNLSDQDRSNVKRVLQEYLKDEDVNARTALFPAGRIWTQNKVVSFWADEKDVTPQQLDAIFNKLNISQEAAKEFYVEFLGDQKPTRSVADYLSKSSKAPEYSPEEQKERDKRKAEALAKAHEAAAIGTKDKEVQEIIDKRKKAFQQARAQAINTGKIPDLATRQAAMTSESVNKKVGDQQLLEEAYQQVVTQSPRLI